MQQGTSSTSPLRPSDIEATLQRVYDVWIPEADHRVLQLRANKLNMKLRAYIAGVLMREAASLRRSS